MENANGAARSRKAQTKSRIYQFLYRRKGFCSKQIIADELGLSLPTVYQNLTELMNEGLIGFSGEQLPTGGRRVSGLDIVADARIAVGVSLTHSGLRFSAADLRLNELCSRRVELGEHRPGNFDTCQYVAAELERFLDENGLDREKLLGVGIAIPAVFDASGASIVLAPTLQLQNRRLCAFQDVIPYPVQVQNDAKCAGCAEVFLRSGSEERNVAYLSLQNGVGGAILLGGELLQGDHLRSAEFGHICIEPEGRPCACGKRGCLEAYCSPDRITAELGVSPDEFFREIRNGNGGYFALWQDMLKHLAVGINSINMMLDCDVVLGGYLSEYMEPWMSQLRHYVAAGNPFDDSGSFVELGMIKSHSVALGAALHFVKKFTESI